MTTTIVDFPEIQRDLDIKRAAATPAAERPAFDPHPPAAEGPAGAGPVDAIIGELVGEALVTCALAGGRTQVDTPSARAVVGAAIAGVRARLGEAGMADDGPPLGRAALSVLAEAELVRLGEPEVAKALVVHRAARLEADAPPGGGVRLIRRNGQVVNWNTAKIATAIRKAFLSVPADPAPAEGLAERVSERVSALGTAYISLETVQDIVQEELVFAGQMRVAERYIIYRAERALLRARGERDEPVAAPVPVEVIDPDGRAFTWDGEDLRERIRFARIGLDLPLNERDLEGELRRGLGDGLAWADLRHLVVLNARSLVERDSDFSPFAARILLTHIYEETLDWQILRDGIDALGDAHRRALRPALERGIDAGLLDPRLRDYDLDRLAEALDHTADLDFDFLGIQTLYDRYLTTDKRPAKPERIEAPQLFWLRVAMGVCLPETTEREERVLALYTLYKERRFCSSTPTLFNAGTRHSQLSSCYVYVVDDSLESIMQRGIAENAMCSKWAGGLGGSWTRVRGTGSFIAGTNGESQGLVPFLKLHNDQLVAVNQGGKRAGSGCAYLEVWHNDIRDFLKLKRNTGDERRRTHDMSTAVWIPDLFMQRVEARAHWTLFRSSEVPELHDLYGRAFAERYAECEARAERGEIFGERIAALELWKRMLQMLFETGHPWLTFKDPCNVRSPQDHVGVVHSSNLCTEIVLNTSDEETAVCNLGSVVVDRHLTVDGQIDHAALRETVRIAVRALDNVIDVNFYPTEPARRANQRHRPVGLGVMGLHYALYRKGLAFASQEAVEFNDELMEAIAYYAYEASSDLAAERGTYASYVGSKWDRGILPHDSLDLLEAERGEPVTVPRGGRMDWAPLRERIARQGMRNSNVLAIAPTATIANIMGTSPCIEPLYKNLFVKSNLSGDFVVLNPFLVRDLKAEGLWNADLAQQLKYFDGDLTEIAGIPEEIRQRCRTAFQIEPEYLIDAAARRQKWIDQSQSVNLFLDRPDMRTISHMYRRAWRAGLKTTYYLRTLGASGISKATVSTPVVSAEAASCGLSPDECEACQ